MEKVIRLGSSQETGSVYCKIRFNAKRLSISGVEGPRVNGNCEGGAGQIDNHMKNGYFDDFKFAPGWDQSLVGKFLVVWDRWHLNDMNAGCEHQRAARWTDVRIDPKDLPKTIANRDERGILASWVYRKEHPKGLLMEPCPVCNYKYGSAWLYEDVPSDVIEFLSSLPDTDKTPAWV